MTANAQEMQHFTDIALLTNYVKIWYLGSAPISQTQHLKQATSQSYLSSGGMVYNRPPQQINHTVCLFLRYKESSFITKSLSLDQILCLRRLILLYYKQFLHLLLQAIFTICSRRTIFFV